MPDRSWWDEQPRTVHFTGIAGYGMAGLARLLHDAGHHVSGTDASDNPLLTQLRAAGIDARLGHDSAAVPTHADLLVRTSAVRIDHPECLSAERNGIPVRRRGEVLAEWSSGRSTLAVAGTHGKTTTATMIVWLLRQVGEDPGHAIGADTAWLEGPGRGGDPTLLVVEADESDGTLIHYAPTVGVITNLEFDHMETFENEAAFRESFRVFCRRSSSLVWCGDDPALAALTADAGAVGDAYGLGTDNRWRAMDVVCDAESARFTVVVDGVPRAGIELPVTGHHQVLNALAALAATARLVGIEPALEASWEGFQLPGRRFQEVEGSAPWRVVHDYAHHPTEIRTVVDVARIGHIGRVVMLYQPHRYSRTRALLSEFPQAFSGIDHLVLAPVFEASEAPLEGGTTEDLARMCETKLAVPVQAATSLQEAESLTRAALREGDLLLVVGAGDVVRLAAPLAE